MTPSGRFRRSFVSDFDTNERQTEVADFLDLTGTISVPEPERTTTWDEVIRRTLAARAADRR